MRALVPTFSRPALRMIHRPARNVRVRLSPMSEDAITQFQILNVGISAMLLVFTVGKAIMNMAERSVMDEQKNTPGLNKYESDSDKYNSDSE